MTLLSFRWDTQTHRRMGTWRNIWFFSGYLWNSFEYDDKKYLFLFCYL